MEEATILILALRYTSATPTQERSSVYISDTRDGRGIRLCCINLPTKAKALKSLIEQICKRRWEVLSLTCSFWRGFVIAYGSVHTDFIKSLTLFYSHTRYPSKKNLLSLPRDHKRGFLVSMSSVLSWLGLECRRYLSRNRKHNRFARSQSDVLYK